ncbi:MAG TPA: glutamate-1-semialdehyde 2,1-aminomutase [Pirellulales bacterium]|jgi:glutamate-1-semialdehyde 2,1-aminomutase|nr:glutamate-1-semialdehyde 2,1-aminomutase [Pirellulales bacterium]
MPRDKSQAAFERAKRLMPGGVNSPARAFGGVGGEPIFFERGEGAYLYDLDGNRYIDYVGSWGPLILGHAHPQVIEAVRAAAEKGTSFGAPTEAESELCELIIAAVPSVEKVRLVNSGTEATMSAIRLARGFTGRDVIVKFAGNYHGHVDSLLVAAGSSAATLGVPNSPGVTAGTAKDTLLLQYNDVPGLEAAFKEHGPRIAGVIVEPVVGNMGVVAPIDGFLHALRELTQRHGSLLIFDEVMTGFRVAYGGAQSLFGIRPDLTTLGKIVGGGLPVGAYGGRADIMEHVLPAGKVFQAGTLSGNPLATAAGIAMLKTLRDTNPYPRLEQLSARLAKGLHEAAAAAKVPHTIARVGSMLTLFFSGEPIANWPTASRCDTKRFAQYFWKLIDHGVYMPCSQFEAFFVSAAHTEADIDATIAAAREALAT